MPTYQVVVVFEGREFMETFWATTAPNDDYVPECTDRRHLQDWLVDWTVVRGLPTTLTNATALLLELEIPDGSDD